MIGAILVTTLVWAPIGPKVGHFGIFSEKMKFFINNFELIIATDFNVGPYLKHLTRRIRWYHCFWSQGHLKVTKGHLKVINGHLECTNSHNE